LSIIKENWAKLSKNTLHNVFIKGNIVDTECRIFQDTWTDEYFCVSVNGEALRLICSESIAVSKKYNTARHHNLKHKEKYKNCVGSLKRGNVQLYK
jgi:hypothetical protein